MSLVWPLWKRLIRRSILRHGFVDPFSLLSRLEKFSQPSEVAAPLELLRAGAVFHARGLLNTRAIQSNLDWLWPHWIDRQFDPADPAFLPRAFSLTHINLTHRDWTALGDFESDSYPVVDPRGMVTPYFDGWSIDAVVLTDSGEMHAPSTLDDVDQQLHLEGAPVIQTQSKSACAALDAQATLKGAPPSRLRLAFRAAASEPAWLAILVRPANPEGVATVSRLRVSSDRRRLKVDHDAVLALDHAADVAALSTYHEGDVLRDVLQRQPRDRAHCKVGMATAAMLYRIPEAGEERVVRLEAPLERRRLLGAIRDREPAASKAPATSVAARWDSIRASVPQLHAAAPWTSQHDRSLYTLMLLNPGELLYPGPYTYKRFWFRDAVMMGHALLRLGQHDRVRRLLDGFLGRQRHDGYFQSQEGEWDSNGQALWLAAEHERLSGERLPKAWREAARRAAEWIVRKRLPRAAGELHDGLLPAGFSAEHLGNNDFYYWDDFWSVAGLRAAARLLDDPRWDREAQDFLTDIERSLERSRPIRGTDAFPASPHRRMDAGAVGSLVAGYPLQLVEAGDRRLLSTANYLQERHCHGGAFFQEMIHSGWNAYLTLHLARVFLDAGDERFAPLVERVLDLASPTGQWPEAIHPRTGGGCMGDGQHGWAAAEWLLMEQALFVREVHGALVLCSGLVDAIFEDDACSYGPVNTPHGEVLVSARRTEEGVHVRWDASWRGGDGDEGAPRIVASPPGCESRDAAPSDGAKGVLCPFVPAASANHEEVAR